MNAEEFETLQVGDLLKYNNHVTTDEGPLGIVVKARPQTIDADLKVSVRWSGEDALYDYFPWDQSITRNMHILARAKGNPQSSDTKKSAPRKSQT